jgi:hypothetical protein
MTSAAVKKAAEVRAVKQLVHSLVRFSTFEQHVLHRTQSVSTTLPPDLHFDVRSLTQARRS